MSRIILLGTSSAVPDEHQENTHLMVLSGERGVLIDCPGNPVVRLKQAGVSYDRITDIVLTHFHPDHVSGFGLLAMDLWLMGRQQELHVWGLEDTVSRAEKMLDLFTWDDWPGFYPLHFHALPEAPRYQFLNTPELRLYSSPVKHLIPTIGVRFEFPQLGKAAVYSSDTEPSDAVVDLANRVNVLIHEATGASNGHSSAAQAGDVAARAQAASLYLIHYDGHREEEALIEAARQVYSGPVFLAKDFMQIVLNEESPTNQEGLPLHIFP